MEGQGVHAYLLLIDPESLTVVWANDNVEGRTVERSSASAVGQHVSVVIPFADAVGIPERLTQVATTGETSELQTLGFSVEGKATKTSASMYRLPSGQLLLASEYVVDGLLK